MASRRTYDDTGGAFDVTLGPLVLLLRRGTAPAPARIEAARDLVDGRGLRVRKGYAELAQRGMSVDLGGIGKGYALDRIALLLRNRGAPSGFLNFGGSTMVAFGDRVRQARITRLDGSGWEDVQLRDRALSTSRSAALDGPILAPRTGEPARGQRTVSLLMRRATEADAWTTALIVMGRPGLKLLKETGKEYRVWYEDEGGEVREGR